MRSTHFSDWFLTKPTQSFHNSFFSIDYFNDVLVIGKTENQDSTTKKTKLLESKSYASGVSLDESTLWITGGKNRGGNFALNSTEFVQINRSVAGPDLPFTIRHHGMVMCNNLLTFLATKISWNCDFTKFLSAYYNKNKSFFIQKFREIAQL